MLCLSSGHPGTPSVLTVIHAPTPDRHVMGVHHREVVMLRKATTNGNCSVLYPRKGVGVQITHGRQDLSVLPCKQSQNTCSRALPFSLTLSTSAKELISIHVCISADGKEKLSCIHCFFQAAHEYIRKFLSQGQVLRRG